MPMSMSKSNNHFEPISQTTDVVMTSQMREIQMCKALSLVVQTVCQDD